MVKSRWVVVVAAVSSGVEVGVVVIAILLVAVGIVLVVVLGVVLIIVRFE